MTIFSACHLFTLLLIVLKKGYCQHFLPFVMQANRFKVQKPYQPDTTQSKYILPNTLATIEDYQSAEKLSIL